MPHEANAIIRGILPADTEAAARGLHLTAANISTIAPALRRDAFGIYYSAVLSFLDALNGLNRGYFSWSIIKMYYCCFYSARTILALNDIVIFYVLNGRQTGKPFSLNLRLGGTPKKEEGNTHKLVWKVLERDFSNNPLLGTIEDQKAYTWMTNLREEANYKNPRFVEPVIPKHFSLQSSHNINNVLSNYLTQTDHLYTFDPDHAAIAFPLACLQRAKFSMGSNLSAVETADFSFLMLQAQAIGLPPEFLRLFDFNIEG